MNPFLCVVNKRKALSGISINFLHFSFWKNLVLLIYLIQFSLDSKFKPFIDFPKKYISSYCLFYIIGDCIFFPFKWVNVS